MCSTYIVICSFGQSAIFLLGGSSKSIKPSAMFIRNGDIVCMAGNTFSCDAAYNSLHNWNRFIWRLFRWESFMLPWSTENHSQSQIQLVPTATDRKWSVVDDTR